MLIGKMDLVTALASFYHLCFCFDLKYPQVFKINWRLKILLIKSFPRKERQLLTYFSAMLLSMGTTPAPELGRGKIMPRRKWRPISPSWGKCYSS